MEPKASAHAAKPPGSPPEQIGPYHIISQLGEGGTGTVYQAIHKDTEEVVALKTVLLPHEKYLTTLRREIHALSRLDHPGIVRILDHGIWEGSPWYAMEFIVGDNLRHYSRQNLAPPRERTNDFYDSDDDEDDDNTSIDLRNVPPEFLETLGELWDDDDDETEINRGAWWTESLRTPSSMGAWDGVDLDAMGDPLDQTIASVASGSSGGFGPLQIETLEDLTPEEARQHFVLTLMRRLCEPLAYLHGEGLVHRDLKPENIVIKPDGQPILIDFGLLTRFGGGVGREQMDARVIRGGTAAYMAPEQFLGEQIDARADIYALGCIFYELLVGHPPFVGSEQEVAAQHMFGQAIPPSMRLKDISKALDALVMRMLARKPRDRTGYARSIAAQLAQWGAAPPDFPEAPRRQYLYPPRMHGRKHELQTLSQLTDQLQGQGCFVGLVGEPGVGKTRMAMEFVRKLSPKKWRFLSATCQEQGVMALQAFRPLLVSLADQIQERGAAEGQRLLGNNGRILGLYEESLFQVMGGEPSSSLASLPPSEARPILLGSLCNALAALAESQPLIYIIDDCHKADELTRAAIAQLLDAGMPNQVILMCLWRKGEADWLDQRLNATTTHPTERLVLELPPLEAKQIAHIVSDMLAFQDIPPAFVDSLCELSKGNPFFVSTYMQEAIAEGAFVQDEWGRWQLAVDGIGDVGGHHGENDGYDDYDDDDDTAYEPQGFPQTIEITPSPHELDPTPVSSPSLGVLEEVSLELLMEKRLDKLSAFEAVLAAAVAVLGANADFGLLQQLVFAEFDERSLMDGLKSLERLGILEVADDGIWRFASDPMQELTLGRLLPSQRATLHRKAADALQQAAMRETRSERDAQMAHHWHEAGALGKAKAAYKRAADQARARLANAEALQLYQRALALPSEDDPGEPMTALELELELRLAYGELLALTGQSDQATHVLRAGAQQAELHGQPLWQARLRTEMALILSRRGELRRAQPVFEAALVVFARHNEKVEQARIIGNLGNIALEQGHVEGAKQHYREALVLLRDAPDGERILRLIQGNMARLLRLQGHHAASRQLFEKALERHRAAQDTWFEAVALSSLGTLDWLEGALDEALERLEQALQLYRDCGHRRGEGTALGYLSHVLHDRGQADAAQARIRSAIRIMQEVQSPRFEGLFRIYLHRFMRRAGVSPESLAARLDETETLLIDPKGAISNNPSLVLLYCERGHLALSQGESGQEWLAKARQLTQRLHIQLDGQAELSQAIARLQRAQRASQLRQLLLFGESPYDHPQSNRSVYPASRQP